MEMTTRRFKFSLDQELKGTRPLSNLLQWSLGERVLSKLKGTGFDTLRGFNKHLRVDLPLICMLINRYDADTRSFILGSADNAFNIAFGLEDVLYLTGLPIDGKAVTGIDPNDKESVCLRYLGKYEECGTGVRSHISLIWLRENFMTLDDENHSEEEFAYHVRAYVLYAIGCTFAPSQNLMVSPVFLPLLENVDDIGSYAWGAAFLANLHDSMENPSRYSIGFYFPLMIFAYLRFPGLLSMFELDRSVINAFPLVVSWSHVLDLVMRQQFKNHNEVNLVTFFNRLKEEGTGEEQVKWQPYEELSSNFLPQHLKKQVVLSKSRTILICFERAVYHRPDKCQRQLGLAGHILKGELIEIKTISRKGRKGKNGKDWSKKGKYPDYISEWDNRFNLLIDRDANAVLDQAEASDHQIDVLVEENAAPDQAKASDYQIDVLVEENAALDQAKATDHQINVLVEANAALDQDQASNHQIDVLVEVNPALDQDNASDHQIDVLLEANAALDQDKSFDHLMDILFEATAAPDQAEASDHTNGDENVALIVAEAGSENDDDASSEKTVVLQDDQDPEKDDASSEKTVVLLDNQDPEKDSCPFEEARRADALLIAELRKENERLKEEIELYRMNFPKHVNRISRADFMENNALNSRVDNVDVDHQSLGDTASSRVRNSSEIQSCNLQREAKKQRVSPSTTSTAGVGVVDRAEPPLIIDVESDVGIVDRAEAPLIIDIESNVGIVNRAEPPLIIDIDSNSDSDSDVSITDSFMDAFVG